MPESISENPTAVEIERRVTAALARVETWMRANAADLADALAPAATSEEIAAAEAELGSPLPVGLKALWSVHGGSQDEVGVLGHRYLLDPGLAVTELDSLLQYVEWLRNAPRDWKQAGVTEVEVTSDRWVGVAGRDSDYLAVSMESGRVFSATKDAPALSLEAASLEDYLEDYARSLERGKYELSADFGGMLARREPEPWERLARDLVAGLLEAEAIALAEVADARANLVDRIGEFCQARLDSGKPLTMTPELPADLAGFLVDQAEIDDVFADDDEVRRLYIAALRRANKGLR